MSKYIRHYLMTMGIIFEKKKLIISLKILKSNFIYFERLKTSRSVNQLEFNLFFSLKYG